MLIKNNCYLDYHKGTVLLLSLSQRDGSFAIIGNMSAEFSAHISGLQKYHKFPMVLMDCREFFVILQAVQTKTL